MPGDEQASVAAMRPSLAIVMPALDEEAAVGNQVRALLTHQAFRALPLARIIVVDNGSRDRTAEVARAAGAEVVYEPRRGYGWACLAGVGAAADAEVVLLMDADGSDDFDGAARVARLVLAGEADLAMGARRAGVQQGIWHAPGKRGGVRRMPAVPAALTPQQRAGNAVGALALRLIYGARVSDIAPVRAIRRDALLALDMREMAYGWSTEMLAKAARAGLRIVELPVAAHPRAAGKSKVAGTLPGTIGASAHILRTLWRYRAWRPAIETAPGGPAAAKSACADWEQGHLDADWSQSRQLHEAVGGAPSHARRALFVVARLPVAGQTKTRLGRSIGHEVAAALYRGFLRDLSARLSASAAMDGYDLYWYYTAPEGASETEFAAYVADEGEDSSSARLSPHECSGEAHLASASAAATPSPRGARGLGDEDPPGQVRYLRQPQGDFAVRLWQGFTWLAARGYGRIVVLGSDSPQVPAARIAAAFAALETHDIALGPARDGGYYLLGQRGRPADLFTGIQMSTPRVAAETCARTTALGLSIATLPESFDVDEPADLDTLARALADAPSAEADPAPATSTALAMIRATLAESGQEPVATALAAQSALSHSAEGVAHGAA